MAPLRLRRVDCHGPGLSRRRQGRGFVYLDPAGRRVTEPEILERIRALVIPPAWTSVWICPLANGHIQATGIDTRGRLQYRYHDAWRVRRDRAKFDHMLDFARVLPSLRAAVAADLATEGMGRERVLACAVRLLDLGFFRIGTEGYAEQNQTYGLATLLKRHVTVGDGMVTFDYISKGGKRRLQSIVDPDVHEVVTELKRRRGGGPELLAWRQPAIGVARPVRWCDVRSDDINAYIKERTGLECSAKDFRTWNATVLAAVALAVSTGAPSATARRRCITRAATEVAHYLGNTPTVARSSYIDPRIIDRFDKGETIAGAMATIGDGATFGHPSTQGRVEAAVIGLLGDEQTVLVA